jgi:serine protease AprX
VPSFSAVKGGNFGTRGPDLVAPGVGIVSLRVPGSTIADSHPAATVGTAYLRGSGTSQAAAVVSGAAALLLQQRPDLTPDQVKALLMGSATPIRGVPTGSQGQGELDLAAAAAAPTPARPRPPAASTGTGSMESARGGYHVSTGGQLLQGEYSVWGQWDGTLGAARTANASIWSADGTTWNGAAITGPGFTSDTTSVAGRTWSGRTWAGRTWAGRTWAGSTWTGRTWASVTWSGRTWADGTWADGTWADAGWK